MSKFRVPKRRLGRRFKRRFRRRRTKIAHRIRNVIQGMKQKKCHDVEVAFTGLTANTWTRFEVPQITEGETPITREGYKVLLQKLYVQLRSQNTAGGLTRLRAILVRMGDDVVPTIDTILQAAISANQLAIDRFYLCTPGVSYQIVFDKKWAFRENFSGQQQILYYQYRGKPNILQQYVDSTNRARVGALHLFLVTTQTLAAGSTAVHLRARFVDFL